MRNALAAANIWSPLSVRTTKIRQIFNLAVPANEFVNLAQLMTQGDLEDYRDILRDGPPRDAFHEFDWLPTRQGALSKTLPVHDPNDLYDTTFRLFTLQSPFLMGKMRWDIDLLSDKRFVDLDANLHYFERRYAEILVHHNERRDSIATTALPCESCPVTMRRTSSAMAFLLYEIYRFGRVAFDGFARK